MMASEKRNDRDRTATAPDGRHLPLNRRGFLAAALSAAVASGASGASPAHASGPPRPQGPPVTTYAWEYAYVYAYG